MPIDSKLSDQFRLMLQYAIQNKVEKFMAGIAEVGYTPHESMLALAIRVTGHVVVGAAERYPNDADLEKIAGYAAKARTNLPVDEEDSTKASAIPMFALANLLVVFAPKGLDQWSYLDVIEASIEAVENTNEPVLPSMVYEFCRPKK